MLEGLFGPRRRPPNAHLVYYGQDPDGAKHVNMYLEASYAHDATTPRLDGPS